MAILNKQKEESYLCERDVATLC